MMAQYSQSWQRHVQRGSVDLLQFSIQSPFNQSQTLRVLVSVTSKVAVCRTVTVTLDATASRDNVLVVGIVTATVTVFVAPLSGCHELDLTIASSPGRRLRAMDEAVTRCVVVIVDSNESVVIAV